MAESFNHFGEIADALHETLQGVVKKTAFDIQAKAARNAPVDTGFLKSSIYVTAAWGSTYAQELEQRTALSSKPTKSGKPRKLSARQQALKSAMDTSLLNEIAVDTSDDLTAYVAVGAEYGIYVEMGTRHMPPHPYFLPAVEAAKPGFEEALSRIEAKLKEAIR